jgi:hypothetical protein
MGLLLTTLLMASLASADSIDNFTIEANGQLGTIRFSLPATEPSKGFNPPGAPGAPIAFYFPFNFAGGVLGGVLYFYDPTFGDFASTGIISYPPGFVQDPSLPFWSAVAIRL